jgi:hypothetical protein
MKEDGMEDGIELNMELNIEYLALRNCFLLFLIFLWWCGKHAQYFRLRTRLHEHPARGRRNSRTQRSYIHMCFSNSQYTQMAYFSIPNRSPEWTKWCSVLCSNFFEFFLWKWCIIIHLLKKSENLLKENEFLCLVGSNHIFIHPNLTAVYLITSAKLIQMDCFFRK